jgi:hypothetical protein
MISIFGLNVAAYWAELLNIYPRVIKKKKEEVIQSNGFFTIDREYIKQRTSLEIADQVKCDKALVNVGAVAVDPEDPNFICISLNRMFEILSEDDMTVIMDIQKKAKSRKGSSAETKAAMIRMNLKKAFTETDSDILAAYHTWIDALMDGKSAQEVCEMMDKKREQGKGLSIKNSLGGMIVPEKREEKKPEPKPEQAHQEEPGENNDN